MHAAMMTTSSTPQHWTSVANDNLTEFTTIQDEQNQTGWMNGTEDEPSVADMARMSVLWQAGIKMHQYYLPLLVPVGGVGNILSFLVSSKSTYSTSYIKGRNENIYNSICVRSVLH